MRGRLAFAIVGLGGLVWLAPLLPNPARAVFWRGGAYSDLLITHWPNAWFLRRSLAEWGQVPLWNPTILSGTPFFADPLSGLWYPPIWLAAAIQPVLAFNLVTLVHLVWGGLGTWRVLRSLGVEDPAAVLGGLAFSGTPKLLGHVGLGHVTLVFAMTWTPWVLLAIGSAARYLEGDLRTRLQRAALAGASLGLVFLIDPRWLPMVVLLGVPFGVWSAAHSHQAGRRRWGLRGVGSLGAAGGIAAGIAAGLALPLGEFVQLSTRSGLSAGEAASMSLPLTGLAQLVVADYVVSPEWQAYAGTVVLFLAWVGLVIEWRRAWFWGAAVVLALGVALGDSLPFYGVLRTLLPGFDLLRVPPRSLILADFALIVLAALGLDRVLRAGVPRRLVVAVGASLVATAALVGWWTPTTARSESPLGQLPVGVTLGLIAACTALCLVGGRVRRFAWVGWVLLLLLDLGWLSTVTLETRLLQPEVNARAATAAGILSGIPPGRSYSPSNSIGQPSATLAGIETADGINPLQLANYGEYIRIASGIPEAGYSVTVPPYPESGPDTPRRVRLNADELGKLSIGVVISAYEVESDALEPVGRIGGHYAYSNPRSRPRAWVEKPGEPAWWRVHSIEWTPNWIGIVAEGPGRLVLSEVTYPGWEAEVDGEPVELGSAYGMLRAIELPPGEHRIDFELRPASLYGGLAITTITVLAAASLWIRR